MSRSYRRGVAPWGLWGGQAGGIGDSLDRRPGDDDFSEHFGHRELVSPGTEVIARMQGGGGWGDPLERPPETVRQDVLEDLVSKDAARTAYGVVLSGEDFSVDVSETEALRHEIAAARATSNGNGKSDDGSLNPLSKRGENAYLTDLTVFATGVKT